MAGQLQVDSHVHVISDRLDEYRLDPLPLGGVWTPTPGDDVLPWFRAVPCTTDELLLHMAAGAVDRAVLVSSISAYKYDNRYAAHSAAARPDVFTSVAVVDTTGPGAAMEMERLVLAEARGLRWWGIDGAPLDVPTDLWAVIDRHRVPVDFAIRPERLADVVAVVAELPPSVKLLVDHCGDVEFDHGIPDELRALAAFENVAIKIATRSLDAMARHGDPAQGLAEMVAVFGAHRLMWGSNYSFDHDRSYAELAQYGRDCAATLDADDRDLFLGGTALAHWPDLAPR